MKWNDPEQPLLNTIGGNYAAQQMNNSSSPSWLSALSGITNSATGIIGAIKGPPKPAPVATPTEKATAWMPIVLIGGGVLLVIGILFAIRK